SAVRLARSGQEALALFAVALAARAAGPYARLVYLQADRDEVLASWRRRGPDKLDARTEEELRSAAEAYESFLLRLSPWPVLTVRAAEMRSNAEAVTRRIARWLTGEGCAGCT
ncbi:MAG: hypothetical protein H5T86_07645, partial [Armatimonadetes bacterium]|nr:hypothetical protein [Armatimonadota bacterium]